MAVRAPSAPTLATRCKQVLACMEHADSLAASFQLASVVLPGLTTSWQPPPMQALLRSSVDGVASPQKPQVLLRLRNLGLFCNCPHLPSHVLAAPWSVSREGASGERASLQGGLPAQRGGVGRPGWAGETSGKKTPSSRPPGVRERPPEGHHRQVLPGRLPLTGVGRQGEPMDASAYQAVSKPVRQTISQASSQSAILRCSIRCALSSKSPSYQGPSTRQSYRHPNLASPLLPMLTPASRGLLGG